MTDNEIIKALECCLLSNEQQESRCEDCPMEVSHAICQELLAFHALDLINRQKAEIEDLKTQRRVLAVCWKDTRKYLKTAKSEAIKEFAERLNVSFGSYTDDTVIWVREKIDNLVKEMVGESNG